MGQWVCHAVTLLHKYIGDMAKDPIAFFQKHNNAFIIVLAALSKPGESTLRSFDALTGHLLLEMPLHYSNPTALPFPSCLHHGTLYEGKHIHACPHQRTHTAQYKQSY